MDAFKEFQFLLLLILGSSIKVGQATFLIVSKFHYQCVKSDDFRQKIIVISLQK